MKNRVYIAGPMSGIPDFNFPAFFEAEERLKGWGWKVVNPARLDMDLGFDPEIDEPMSHEAYMRRDLPLLAKCDAIALLPGWSDSQGARNELAVAEMCGLDTLCALDGQPMEYEPESPLFEAHRLVHSDRGLDYGPPERDFARTGRMWGAILGVEDVSPRLVALCMVALKVSREAYHHKRDNLTDIAGYTETVAVIEGES